ncbi:transposable element Tcb2 transposase [Trichonephila clavipes]|uniref:Transposable element Tcb2 transposase n=1 Tax=Trichonephila clavipes TaxID=2585209 RepID=A0A8X6SLN7_TRICX|nr:transposable element Tcb2 transposase [Trichonephila clavipes]
MKSAILKELIDIKEEQIMANEEFEAVTVVVTGLKPVKIGVEKLCSQNGTLLTAEGKAEVDRPLHHHRRQYEHLLKFERRRIIGMMEAGWSARRIVCQAGHSDLTARWCWDQCTEEKSFTRRPGSERPTRE